MLLSSQSLRRAWLASNVLLPIAILLFATGFFPYKPFIPGLAKLEDHDDVAPAIFDKVIFMVVDALRSDFVYSSNSGFNFTQGLINAGVALPFTAHAAAPTITMPRVKAMTTGSVPSFLDVILNFAESDTTSALSHQDTWLAQIKAQPDAHLLMYGDDTWLKLFPDFFHRHDGTSSFFVSDFIEVDNNVTRHIPEELMRDDWSAMIMHYLGLDHIGHKAGPGSPHMVPKQREMDGIVEEIYSSLEEQDHLSSTLFVLCGDHGMNDGGNHGGSSPGETSAALVFMSPHFKQLQANAAAPAQQSDDFQFYETVEQSDIAPTLAGLLGFAVPLNSLGVFIPDFLPSWKDQSQRIAVLLRNARQLLNVVKTKFPYHNFDGPMDREACASNSKSDDVVLGCYWSEALLAIDKAKAGERSYDTAESALLAFSREAQRVMSNVASNYNIKSLHTASGLGALSTLMSLAASIPLLRNQALTSLVFLTFVAVYGATMIASSYVEEEQQSWHWILSGWHCYLFIKSGGLRGSFTDTLRRILTLFVFPRFIRRWNQTGQKFTGEPDLVDFLYTKPCLLWALVTYTYLGIFSRLFTSMAAYKSRCKSVAMALPAVIVAFLFKVAFTHAQSPELIPESVSKLQHLTGLLPDISLVTQARIGFILMAVIVVLNFARWDQHGKSAKAASAAIPRERKFKVLHEVMTLFLATQSRAENIPMFQLYSWQVSTMSRLQLSSFDVLVTSLVQQYTSFFAFGGSNSISSIDLSSAYNGISGYNVIAVGILTFVGNWAGPIWWVFATQELLLRHGNRTGFRREVPGQAPPLWQRLSLLTFFVSSSLLAVMLACTALRTHLFIWSVFSPKFLYSMAWTLAHYLIVNVLLGGVILSLI